MFGELFGRERADDRFGFGRRKGGHGGKERTEKLKD
jgi:hypothetical protein